MKLSIEEISPTAPELTSQVGPLIRVLRPGLSVEQFAAFAGAAEQGLVFLAGYDGDGRCVAAAAYRVLATSRGRLLFVDDLVTDPDIRSRGAGAQMLADLERRGSQAGCVRIELDSGVTNQAAHRFYHSRRMAVTAFHFAGQLPG